MWPVGARLTAPGFRLKRSGVCERPSPSNSSDLCVLRSDAQAEKPDADGRLNEDRVHLDRIKRVLALQRLNETGILGTNAAAQQEDDVAIAAALAKLQGKLEPLKQTQSVRVTHKTLRPIADAQQELVLGRSKPVESSAAQKADPSVKKGMQV